MPRENRCLKRIDASDHGRIILGLSSKRLYIGGSNSEISAAILNLKISWQAQYSLRLEVDIACSAHWKLKFHMRRGSIMRFILRGRRSFW